jgi:hypothetical protein
MAIVYRPTEDKQVLVESKPGTGPFVFHETPTAQNLALNLQRLPFGRWSCAISRSKPAVKEQDNKISSKNDELIEPTPKLLGALESILALPSPSSLSASVSETAKIQWKQDMDMDISASYGHVLHHAKSDARVAVASKGVPKLQPDNSLFLKRVPNLSRVIPHLGLSQSTEGQEIVSFKLLPSLAKIEMSGSIKVFNRVELFPEIYVEFVVKNEPDSSRSAQLHQVYAKVQEKLLDAMLPTCATDIRFRRSVVAQADVQSIVLNQTMKEFLQQAQSHCMGYGNLQNPSPVKITVPKRMLQQKTGNKSGEGVPHSDHKDVYYIFASVEKRHAIPFVFAKHDVSYTGVDAGKIGGSWQELSIHMPKLAWTEHEPAAQTKVHEEFTRAAFALASRIDLTAKGKIQPPQSKRQLETNISTTSTTSDTVATVEVNPENLTFSSGSNEPNVYSA